MTKIPPSLLSPTRLPLHHFRLFLFLLHGRGRLAVPFFPSPTISSVHFGQNLTTRKRQSISRSVVPTSRTWSKGLARKAKQKTPFEAEVPGGGWEAVTSGRVAEWRAA